MAETLVIVESPAKAKTIGKFLGSKYKVIASNGHVRDLPKSQLGVDVEHNFTPKYITLRGRGDVLETIRREAKNAKKIYLATDPDMEGEAISWHLAQILKLDIDSKCRIEFNEITANTVKNSVKAARAIDMNLVDAQQARRVLDRLVGYKISPILWAKVRRGLSAGRVQSVACRILCDREKEIMDFVPEEYWLISAQLKIKGSRKHLPAKFYGYGDKRTELHTQAEAEKVVEASSGVPFQVTDIKVGERTRHAPPPFTTSSLQQEAVKKLNFSTKKTMLLAQQLYEGVNVGKGGAVGLITYMRTDSVRLSDVATAELRSFIGSTYGAEYVPAGVNVYSSKKNAQDAHEAIRPTSVERTPEAVAQYLTKDQLKLYTLIWKRTVACQMKAAVYDVTTLLIGAAGYQLRAGGAVLKFDGFLKLSDKKELAGEKEKEVPYLPEQTPLKLHKLMPAEQHFTEPPPHFTEATLVKELEEKGIGRPSTYSPTIQTILDRGYIVKDGKKLVSTELGELIVNMLTTYFKDIINIPFTANLETELDEIAEHEANKETVLENFYEPFSHLLQKADKEIETVEAPVEVSDVKCEKCGRMMVYKQGRYGKFLACPGFPECRNTKPILKKIGVKCPDCGGDIIERKTKTRKVFYGCSNYPECKFTSWDKPTEQHCPKCGHILYEKTDRNGNKKLFCTNENCEDAVKTYKGKAAANAKSK